MAPPDLSSATGTPAGYGRSCTNCSKAKCKCILRADGVACERCHRLGKSCQPMATSRRRTGKKTTTSRTAQLEEKLDDLVSILRASQSANQHQLPTAASTSAAATASASSFAEQTPFSSCSRLESLATAATSTNPQAHQPKPMPHPFGILPVSMVLTDSETTNIEETWRLPEPTPAEAEIYLEKFRKWLNSFPCMVLPPDITAEKLREEKPFLWLCIMNITSMSVPQQAQMKERVRSEAATRVLVNQERGMDVLLGLIVYVGWATLNAGPTKKPFLISFCQLAAIIIYDMSLTRAPIEEQYFTVCFKLWGGRPAPPKLRTMEERRALLSVWFLSSTISGFVGKMDSLRWTPHMEDCLSVLEREQDHPADEILVHLVKTQLVAEEAQKLLIKDVMGESGQVPTYVFRKGLLAKLHEIRGALSVNMMENHVLQSHMLTTEVQVHSVGLFMQTIPQVQRIESMYSCLKAIRSWYDTFFSIPLLAFPGLPFSFYMHLSTIQVALYRLTTSEDPAWDKDLVRNTADLLLLLDQICDRLVAVGKEYVMKTEDPEDTVFCKGAKIQRNIRSSWEPILSRHLGGIPTPNSQAVTNQAVEVPLPQDQNHNYPVPEHLNITDPPMSMEFGDMAWWTDVFPPWDF